MVTIIPVSAYLPPHRRQGIAKDPFTMSDTHTMSMVSYMSAAATRASKRYASIKSCIHKNKWNIVRRKHYR